RRRSSSTLPPAGNTTSSSSRSTPPSSPRHCRCCWPSSAPGDWCWPAWHWTRACWPLPSMPTRASTRRWSPGKRSPPCPPAGPADTAAIGRRRSTQQPSDHRFAVIHVLISTHGPGTTALNRASRQRALLRRRPRRPSAIIDLAYRAEEGAPMRGAHVDLADRTTTTGTSPPGVHLPVLLQLEAALPAQEVETVFASLLDQFGKLARRKITNRVGRVDPDAEQHLV